MRRCVGVLGGMGPEATADFLTRLVRSTPARRDQDHLRVVVDDDPSVPDRSAGVAGTGPSPGPHLARMARGLVGMGAELLVMPCNSAHAFEEQIRAAVPGVPFLSMIEATVEATRVRVPSAARIGLLATDGTLSSGVYARGFAAAGVAALAPDAEGQREVMRAIYAIKGGAAADGVASDGAAAAEAPASAAAADRAAVRGPAATLRHVAERLVAAGAEAIVAACTEVPLVLRDGDVVVAGRAVPVISSTDALVERTVAEALAPPTSS